MTDGFGMSQGEIMMGDFSLHEALKHEEHDFEVLSTLQICITVSRSKSRSDLHTGNDNQHFKQAFPGLNGFS